MLNIGPAELLVIGLVVLIAVGPEQLPSVIRRVGNTVGQFRNMTDGLRTEFMAGLDELERTADPRRWSEDDPAHKAQSKNDQAATSTDDDSDGEPDDGSGDGGGTSAGTGAAAASTAAAGARKVPHPAPFASSSQSSEEDATAASPEPGESATDPKPPDRTPFDAPGTHLAAAGLPDTDTDTDTEDAAEVEGAADASDHVDTEGAAEVSGSARGAGAAVDLEASAAAEALDAAESEDVVRGPVAVEDDDHREPDQAGGRQIAADPIEGREPELLEGGE